MNCVSKKPVSWVVYCSAPVDNAALISALLQGPQTGVALAAQFGITRAAVWKRIQHLRNRGLQIALLANRAYALVKPTPLMSAQDIRNSLNAQTTAQLRALQVEFDVPSTQALAMAAPTPDTGMAVWVAETQSQGQGRRGKQWCSPPLANIYCSINRRFPISVAAMNGFSLACAVILVRSLRAQGIEGLSLKWPNDIWLEGKKCAGLLIQLRGESGGPCDATVGFGLNVSLSLEAGSAIDQAWTAIDRHYPGPWDRNRILAEALNAFQAGFEEFEREGLAAFLQDWQASDGLFGQMLVLEDGQRRIEGLSHGIDHDGALLLETAQGVQRFHSGELSVKLNHG